MRTIVLADKKIKGAEKARDDLLKFYKDHGVTASIDLHYEDHSDLPWQNYFNDETGRNRGLAKSYIKSRSQAIKKRYHKKYDSILWWVHEDNWLPSEDNIWGWNISREWGGMENQQCRFDKDNPANTFGTYYHEQWHAYDQFVYRVLGKKLKKILKVSDVDDRVVHGESPRFEYIRHKENTDALVKVAPLVNKAIASRVKEQEKYICVIQKLLRAYRTLLNIIIRKDQKYDK